MTDTLNEEKLGHLKSGIRVSYETLIKNTYCNIHYKTVGVGKAGWIYAVSSLYPSHCNSWQPTEKNRRGGHVGSWSEAQRDFSLWLWVPSCRERFCMGEQVEEEEEAGRDSETERLHDTNITWNAENTEQVNTCSYVFYRYNSCPTAKPAQCSALKFIFLGCNC